VLDAPVSGMAAGAKSGMLQIFVGGNRADFERALPVFNVFGDPEKVQYIGDHGTGYTVKLMINALWFVHQQATAEVLMTGVRAGVDLGVLRNALINSPAQSNYVENDVTCVLESGDYDDSFAMALVCKDMGLAVDLAAEVGVPVDVCATVEQLSRRTLAQYGPSAGEMSAVRLLEDVTATPLRLK
jgi:3-hydroxyisobutyrate dehydrogenase